MAKDFCADYGRPHATVWPAATKREKRILRFPFFIHIDSIWIDRIFCHYEITTPERLSGQSYCLNRGGKKRLRGAGFQVELPGHYQHRSLPSLELGAFKTPNEQRLSDAEATLNEGTAMHGVR